MQDFSQPTEGNLDRKVILLGDSDSRQFGLGAGRVLKSMARNIQQFGQAPNVVGQSGFHCRSHAQAAMNAAEVVVARSAASRFQVFEFTGERQGQARESRNLHSHREVLAFDKAGRDLARVRIPASHLGYNLRDSWWGVAPFVLPKVSKQLRELGEVRIRAKRCFNSLLVEDAGIGGQLNPVVGNPATRRNSVAISMSYATRVKTRPWGLQARHAA